MLSSLKIKKPIFIYSLAPALLLIALVGFVHAEGSQVVSFFPQGSVKQVRQVTVRFSSDMIAMGDPRSAIDPFTMTCNVVTKKESHSDDAEAAKTDAPKFTTRWAD